MKFKMFAPYSQLDIHIIESLDGFIHDVYPTIDELIEEEGDCDYTEMEVDGITIRLMCGNWLTLDDISMN